MSLRKRLFQLSKAKEPIQERVQNRKEYLAMSEEVLSKLLEKLTSMEQDIKVIKDTMITKEVVEKIIVEQPKDVIALLERTATKEDIAKISDTQSIHSEWLRTLAADTSQHTAEINLLKRAK